MHHLPIQERSKAIHLLILPLLTNYSPVACNRKSVIENTLQTHVYHHHKLFLRTPLLPYNFQGYSWIDQSLSKRKTRLKKYLHHLVIDKEYKCQHLKGSTLHETCLK